MLLLGLVFESALFRLEMAEPEALPNAELGWRNAESGDSDRRGREVGSGSSGGRDTIGGRFGAGTRGGGRADAGGGDGRGGGWPLARLSWDGDRPPRELVLETRRLASLRGEELFRKDCAMEEEDGESAPGECFAKCCN